MKQRVESLVQPKAFHYLEGDALLPLDECDRYTQLLKEAPIDLCCLGVGENGHIAFNDPPVAQLDDAHWVKLVKLDDACKGQQVNEGHFESLETVPPYALTLTIPALCAARRLICLSPETRKAKAVQAALEGESVLHALRLPCEINHRLLSISIRIFLSLAQSIGDFAADECVLFLYWISDALGWKMSLALSLSGVILLSSPFMTGRAELCPKSSRSLTQPPEDFNWILPAEAVGARGWWPCRLPVAAWMKQRQEAASTMDATHGSLA